MQNSTKVMLIAVLLLIVIIAVVWDRQNEKIKEGQIHVPVRLSDEIGPAEREPVPRIEPAIVVGEIGTGDPLPAPPPRLADGGYAPAWNVESREPESSPPVAEAPGPVTRPVRKYKVEPGDSFWTIARKFYGDGNKWRKIFDANKDEVPTPEALRAKMTIFIPEQDSPAGGTSAAEESSSPASGQRIHVVAKGETLSGIAERYYGKPDYRPILSANADKIPDKNRLRIGARIVIPEKRGE